MKLEKSMTNMFKKSLVALAVAGFASTAFAAPLTVTQEFLTVAENDELVSNPVVIELGKEYTEQDTIVLTMTGGSIDGVAGWQPVITVAPAAPLKGITLGLLNTSADGTTATYRVTNVTGDAADQTTGIELTFTSFTFVASTIASSGVSVDWCGYTNLGAELECNDDDLITVAQQYSFAVSTDYNAVIDVEENRTQFVLPSPTNAGNNTLNDTATFAVTDNTAFDMFASTTGIDYTLTGDFSWVNTAAVVEVANCAGATTGSLNVAKTEVTFSCTDTNAVSVTLDVANNTGTTLLQPTTFSVSAEVSYTDGAIVTPVAADIKSSTYTDAAGEWTLNGSLVNIPYMPYGTNITQVINLTNTGGQTGGITVEGYDRTTNTRFGPYDLPVVAAPYRQVALAEAIKNALEDNGHVVDGAGERYYLTIVTNVAADDVEVYSAYNTGNNGARLVVNDSNGRK